MRENGLLAPHRVGRTEAGPHDATIITDKVNEMWGTDITQTITIREGRANVFVAVEHSNFASRRHSCIAFGQSIRGPGAGAAGGHRCFGAIAPGVARGLKLRHDHGSNYMSGDFQDEIGCLGIALLRARTPGQWRRRALHPNLENLRHHRRAASRYNETWLVARHGYRTPARARADQCRLDPNTTADLL
jgi:putative transposase